MRNKEEIRQKRDEMSKRAMQEREEYDPKEGSDEQLYNGYVQALDWVLEGIEEEQNATQDP